MFWLTWKVVIQPWVLVTFYGYKRVINVYNKGDDGKYYLEKTIPVDNCKCI